MHHPRSTDEEMLKPEMDLPVPRKGGIDMLDIKIAKYSSNK
jgi:hypothetical protein